VIEAKNGRDGLLLRRRRLTSVALIVTDVVMPEMTGPEMASELWRTDPKLPVVFLSGYADSALDPQTLPANAALLSKPFTSGLLAAKVREQIDRSRGTDQHLLELRHGDLAAAVGLIA
jgi:FixJ family two-component response regulator